MIDDNNVVDICFNCVSKCFGAVPVRIDASGIVIVETDNKLDNYLRTFPKTQFDKLKLELKSDETRIESVR